MKFKPKIKVSSYVITAATFMLVGFFIGSAFANIKTKSALKLATTEVKIISSCRRAVDALNSQGDSCLEAYKILRSCVNDKNCDLEVEGQKLQRLEKQRKEAEEILTKENEMLDQLKIN